MPKPKLLYKRKECVGNRQLYRRINESVHNVLHDIHTRELCEITLPKFALMGASTSSPQNFESCGEVNSDKLTCSEIVNPTENLAHDFSVETNSIIENSYFNVDDNISYNDNNTKPESYDLRSQLQRWAVINHVPLATVTDLLHILHPVHPSLPLNARSLLNTPIILHSKILETGEYCHLGLKAALEFLLQHEQFSDTLIKISFNIDGLPLFHSTNTQLWPILGLVKNIKCDPFVVGVFCGTTKPRPLSLYLQSFLDEIKILLNDGFYYRDTHYNIEIHSFVCDAPARAFLKCVKSHMGYSACDKCCEPGEYINGKVVMTSTDAPKRTDASFSSQLDDDHHIGISPLTELPIGLVSIFPIDYMHCVCLGVMRKLLNSWIGGNLSVRLGNRLTTIISNHLISVKKFIPKEFNRKPRSLAELARWKASEFRTFLLYLGPIVLHNVVNISIYEHFLLLHFAITIFVSKMHISQYGSKIAGNILNIFVNHCKNIYGLDFVVYNVHLLSHLQDDVERYGPLDTFAAFPFENCLGQLKHLLKGPRKPLKQICRRLIERNRVSYNKPISLSVNFKIQHNLGPLPPNGLNYQQFKTVSCENVQFSIYNYCNADSYCMTKQYTVLRIENILVDFENNTFLMASKFLSYDSLYNYPLDSKYLHIFVVKNLSDEVYRVHIDEVLAKCLVIPFKNSCWVSFPLIHDV